MGCHFRSRSLTQSFQNPDIWKKSVLLSEDTFLTNRRRETAFKINDFDTSSPFSPLRTPSPSSPRFLPTFPVTIITFRISRPAIYPWRGIKIHAITFNSILHNTTNCTQHQYHQHRVVSDGTTITHTTRPSHDGLPQYSRAAPQPISSVLSFFL
jgi:hypothetical protein